MSILPLPLGLYRLCMRTVRRLYRSMGCSVPTAMASGESPRGEMMSTAIQSTSARSARAPAGCSEMTKSTLKKIVGIGVKNEDLRTVCKLRLALVCIRAFARPIWSDVRCGDEMRKIDADCLDDICDMVDVALAAPKEVKP